MMKEIIEEMLYRYRSRTLVKELSLDNRLMSVTMAKTYVSIPSRTTPNIKNRKPSISSFKRYSKKKP